MKKLLFSLYVGVVLLLGGASLQAGEFFAEGLVKGVPEAAEKGLAEGGEVAFNKTLTESFDKVGILLDDASKGLKGDALEAFKKAVADSGESIAGEIGGKVGTLSVDISDKTLTEVLDKLNAIEGVKIDPAAFKSAVGEVDAKVLNSSIIEAPAEASTIVSEEASEAAVLQKAAKDDFSSFAKESKKLDTLNATKAALEKEGADTTVIDAEIQTQKAVVDNYGYGTVTGALAKKFGSAVDALGNLKSSVKSTFSKSETSLKTAQAEVGAAEETLSSATKKLEGAQNELKVATEKLEAANGKLEEATLKEKTPEVTQEIEALNEEINSLTNDIVASEQAIKEATSEIDIAVKDYAGKAKTLTENEVVAFKNSNSTALAAFKEAEAKVKLAKVAGDTEGFAAKVDEASQARAAAREEGSFTERAKLKAKDKVKGYVNTTLQTFGAGVIFMIPGFILGAFNDEQARAALLDTISRPQKFGDIYMQIPTELINQENPLASIFLYVGFPGGDCAAGTFEDGSCRMDETKIDATRDFYVSEGSSDFEGWATQPITSTSFSGNMIHLNTGYTFGANGQPTEALFPSKQLLNSAAQENAAKYNTPVSVAGFLDNFAQVLSGEITVESFNPALFWDEAKSSEVVGGEDEKPSAEGGEKTETTMNSDELAKIMSWYDDKDVEKSCTIDAKAITPCPQLLQESLVGTIAAPMAWGDSGVNNIWPMTILSDEEISGITGISQSLGGSSAEDEALPAYGIYLYKTTFTDLGKKLNDITKGDAANGIEGLVADYVFALDADNNIVPLRVPMLETGGSYGPSFKFTVNPAVVKVYSVLTGQAIKLADGTTEDVKTDLTGQEAYKKLSARAIGQVKIVQSWYPGALKYGPFTIGTKVLTIDKNLADAGTFVYAIDPAQQPAGISGTLEDGGIDYVVALDADKNVIDIGSAASGPNEFLSLVTSRFYDANLKPYNSENDKEDTDFIVVDCNGNYAVVTGADPGSCDIVSLAGKAGPFKAPFYTLFMDADLNPYNKPSLMSFTAELGKQVGTQVSTLIESAFVAAGVTESMMQKLSSDQRTALINLIIASLPTIAGDDWAMFQTALADYQAKIAAWQNAGKAKSGTEYDDVVAAQAAYISSADAIVADLQTNGTALGLLGTNLTDSSIDSALITALDDVKNQLATAAPRAVIIPSTQKQYVDAGLIPVPDQWAMGLISSAMKIAIQDLVNASYIAWKEFLISTKDQWSLYLDKGPFNISPDGTLIPVAIEATSVDDLAAGVYIYTSDSLPSEFLVVGSGTSDALLGQKFEVLNKTAMPYLLSLSTGKMYDVSSGDLEIVADYTPKTPAEIISFVKSKFPNITDDLVAAITNSEAAVIAVRSAAEFSRSFYRFALLLDNQDADVGAFVYQDITPIADAQNMDRATLLGQVKDFFVYAELQPDGSTYSWGLEMPKVLSDDSRLISLITGTIYSKSGPVGLFENFQEPGLANGAAQTGAFNKIWTIIEDKAQIKGGKIRAALANAVSTQLQVPIAQAQQALAEYVQATKDESLTAEGYNLLTIADVTAINAIAPSDDDPSAVFCSATTTDNCIVSGAYPNLKQYKGKYYQAYQAFLSDVAKTVVDFAVSGGPDDVAILYDITYGSDGTTVTDVTVNTILTGEIRDQSRAAAGVIISGAQQTLGIPNEQPGIDASLLKPIAGFASQTLPFGTVDFYSYKKNAMLYVTPSGNAPSYYLDLYSGIMFNDNGKPISIGGKYAKNSVDDRYLLASRISDGSIDSIIYEGSNGIALEYIVKDIANNPSAPVADATGNYNTKTYIMQARWDSENNLKVVEYSPIAAGTRYYEVTEQSAITYDESNNESLYFQNEVQKFDDVGNFREIKYATGKPADEIGSPSSAYVLESTDGKDEAIFWQDTKSATTGIIDYVVYKKSGTNFVANYSWENIFDGSSGDSSATISFTDNLIDSAASAAYGITIYYSELTDVDNEVTYKFVDKLNILQQDVMNNFLTVLGVTVARDNIGNSILARDLSSVQTMNASSLAGNVYPANDTAKLGDQFRLATVVKATGPIEADTKYLYKIGSSKVASYPDSSFLFNTIIGDGNYIDIETGIAYSSSTNKAIGIVKLTELLLLRDAVIHASAQLIPQCQIDDSCTAGQSEPKKKVLSYMA